jgi:fucose permease
VFLLNADKIVEKLTTLDGAEKFAELNLMALRVINPYLIMAGSLLVVSGIIWLVGLPEIDDNDDKETSKTSSKKIWEYPNLILGIVALFFAVGAEVIAGDYIITYGINIGIPFSVARHFTAYLLVSMLMGYITGILIIPKYIIQEKALLFFAGSGFLLSILAILSAGYVSVIFVILMGFSNAILWPAIWPLALKNIGHHTKMASAFLIMAISGGAILPIFFGKILDSSNPSYAYIIMGICYSFILYYAFYGHKLYEWKYKKA